MRKILRQEIINDIYYTWVDIGENNCAILDTQEPINEEEANKMIDDRIAEAEAFNGTTN